jgi:hypothetical protein
MVVLMNKPNTGRFPFLGFLSESEMLHLGGTLYNYGVCLAEGEGVSKNLSEAIRYFRLAAVQGFWEGSIALTWEL